MVEAKTPTRSAVSWVDGAFQVHDDYEKQRARACSCRTSSPSPPRARSSATARSGMPVEHVGAVARRRTTRTKASCTHVQARGARACCGRMWCSTSSQNFTAVRHRQEAAPHQDHLPLPAVRGRQQDRRARGGGLSQEGPDLALPGLGQVAADGLRRAEAAPAPGAEQPDGA